MKKILTIITHLLFVVLVALVISPASNDKVENFIPFLVCIMLIELLFLLNRKKVVMAQIGIIVYLFLIGWEVYCAKLGGNQSVLFPAPENVFIVYVKDYQKILEGIGTSLIFLGESFFLAIVLGCGLGFIVGISDELTKIILPIAKVLSPIPAIVYTPYAVRLLPSFRAASIFIITLSIFWGLFMGMIMGVRSIDKKIVDSARTLNVTKTSHVFNILIPYSLPKIIDSLVVSISTSFLVLTAAEMIGGTSGLGWYVKYHSDFSQYDQVVNGIITIGITVTLLNLLISKLRSSIIRWQ